MAKKKSGRKRVSYTVKPEGLKTVDWQILLRRQAARDESFAITKAGNEHVTGEYMVESPKTNNVYKVVYRGANSPWNYCSCMDFKASGLGTCKHLESVKLWIHRNGKVEKDIPPYTSVYVAYKEGRNIRIRIGTDKANLFRELAAKYFDDTQTLKPNAIKHFGQFLKEARAIDESFRCYNDVKELVAASLDKSRRDVIIDKYDDKSLDSLLSVKLFPYQKEGVRFAFRAGKSIIADEMGLGKTIQALSTAELMRKEGMVETVLVVCPTSLKYQWKREIERLTKGKSVMVMEGDHLARRQAYNESAAYKIVSYNSLCNDIKILGSVSTDILIMDEVQRLKNWNTQIAKAMRRVVSNYSVILSGTPLENKLEELFSIAELADQYCLGPYYQFKENYIVTDNNGRTIGYKGLNEVGNKLSGVMIRRRKKDVALQMPERRDMNLFVPMTEEQRNMHEDYKTILARLLQKWNHYHFLSEQDRQRLLLTLSKMRMVCDSSYILDQKTRFDTKVGELRNILTSLLSSPEEKVVVFSQWERMTRLVARELDDMGIAYAYLNGSIPSEKRRNLVSDFTDNADIRVFLSTDAGSTGLNLQAAATIINIDLPWNPAVLEQRIARIFRIGQKKNIQVINLIAPDSIEEQMVGKLRFKSSMFEGVLDGGDDAVFLNDEKFSKIVDLVNDVIDTEERQEPSETITDTETPAENPNEWLPTDTAEEEMAGNDSPAKTKEETDIEGNALLNLPKTDTSTQDAAKGMKVLGRLIDSLKTAEGREQLLDNIVKTDDKTGEVSLSIPVPDKKTVGQFLEIVGKLFG